MQRIGIIILSGSGTQVFSASDLQGAAHHLTGALSPANCGGDIGTTTRDTVLSADRLAVLSADRSAVLSADRLTVLSADRSAILSADRST